MITVAEANLLMNGATVEWPPHDMNGNAIEIGAKVIGVFDTFNCKQMNEFIVGGIRLQNQHGCLAWVCCTYDDNDHYFEAFAENCCVMECAPRS